MLLVSNKYKHASYCFFRLRFCRWPSFFGYFRPHLYGCWYGVLKPYQSVYPGVCVLECAHRKIYIRIKSICALECPPREIYIQIKSMCFSVHRYRIVRAEQRPFCFRSITFEILRNEKKIHLSHDCHGRRNHIQTLFCVILLH